MSLFPDTSQASVRVAEMWRVDTLPVPRFQPRCPGCWSTRVILKHWFFHENKHSPSHYRCDVHFKCCDCSMVWLHGVVLTEEQWKARPRDARIRWREGFKLLLEAGVVNSDGEVIA